MKYSKEYKMECVRMYREGRYPETPECLNKEDFHRIIREWYRIEEAGGVEALEHKKQNKERTVEEKYELVVKVLGGQSIKTTAALSEKKNTCCFVYILE